MDLLTAENAIVTRLEDQIKATLTTDFDSPLIQSFPKNPTEHFESIGPNGEILVRFDSQSPEPPEPNREKVIVQNGPINWAIWIIKQDLTNHGGIYDTIDKIKDALIGWTITDWDDSSPMYLTNVQFIEEKGGFWFYEMMFQHIIEESET